MLDETPTELGGPAAGFWRRFAAALVDGILLGVVNVILRIILGSGAGSGIGIPLSLVYFTYFHGKTGQTPGDHALSIKVVDMRDKPGRPIGYGRAFARWVISIVSTIVILIGYLWMLWDPKKQTWHDKAVGSLPVYLGR
ncbi:MAG TPA: RDD family protein [Gaiellaceae bacterium]|jgi:uncharacterized RDD family membrane protein YckC